LHGIPWGSKDLLDTDGIATTYGAEPFRNRIPTKDATVVQRLHDAGAVLIAKLSLGALALNDIWFGGQTMNPWLLEEGASGSSAGPDPGDVSSVPSHLDFDSGAAIKDLRVGYFPNWMKQPPATNVDRSALETVSKLGMRPVEVFLPDWPYGCLNLNLFAEGAASFEELTLSHRVDQLKMQPHDSWPNLFRQARFLSAVDFVQTDRFRRKVCQEMARIFSDVDL